MAQDQWNAKGVATEASKMLGRTVSAKQVRGLARGDNGAPVVPRLADEGYTPHVYSAKERSALLTAFATREAKRTGKAAPKVPAVRETPTKRSDARKAPKPDETTEA